MNQIRSVLVALASAAVITGAAGCGMSSNPPPPAWASGSAATTTSPAAVGASSSACAGLGGTVDADQICHVHSATSSYNLDMTFPLDYQSC